MIMNIDTLIWQQFPVEQSVESWAFIENYIKELSAYTKAGRQVHRTFICDVMRPSAFIMYAFIYMKGEYEV